LLIESGIRFHTLFEDEEKNDDPSYFTKKMRKHLKKKKLKNIEQLGVERAVVFTFGYEDNKTHIILELYAQGNLILTDKDHRVIQTLRQFKYTETAQ